MWRILSGRGRTVRALSAALITVIAGCGGQATVGEGDGGSAAGGAGAGGSGSGAGATGGSGGDGGSGGEAAAWGAVSLVHLRQVGDYPYEQLSLAAAVFAEDYDPEEQAWGFVETALTPDGVPCDIYYQSGGMGEPPPPPPAEIDAGHLSAGAPGDLLAIDFDGQHYEVDWRVPGDPAHPMPSWLGAEPVTLTFAGGGSSQVAAFQDDAVLPAAATILAPTPDQSPVPQQPDGTYLIAWQPSEAEQTLVRLQFNLDWDNSLFRCRPPAGVTQLSLPHAWLVQWTWGYGELLVESRNEVSIAALRMRPSRMSQFSVYFEVW